MMGPVRPHLRRRSGIAPAIALLCAGLGLTACSTPGVCTLEGFSSSLRVQLSGDVLDVADVRWCVDGECSPGAEDQPGPDDQPVSGEIFSSPGHRHGPHQWSFTAFTTPEEITVRVYATDGSIVADSVVEPEWQRVGGSAECGGPVAAAVTVEV